mmetsp:Transcript_97537/g.173714  ORF Transcript_97537/g.173714 Transcript_97537/m.173714 type:complete len:101 (-) Transcript_97537:156-458(-)
MDRGLHSQAYEGEHAFIGGDMGFATVWFCAVAGNQVVPFCASYSRRFAGMRLGLGGSLGLFHCQAHVGDPNAAMGDGIIAIVDGIATSAGTACTAGCANS